MRHLNMGRQLGLTRPARDRGGDHRGTVTVSNVVLNNKNGAQSPLLTSDNGAEIRVKNISSSDLHYAESFPL
jgi:hypothetical protein